MCECGEALLVNRARLQQSRYTYLREYTFAARPTPHTRARRDDTLKCVCGASSPPSLALLLHIRLFHRASRFHTLYTTHIIAHPAHHRRGTHGELTRSTTVRFFSSVLFRTRRLAARSYFAHTVKRLHFVCVCVWVKHVNPRHNVVMQSTSFVSVASEQPAAAAAPATAPCLILSAHCHTPQSPP